MCWIAFRWWNKPKCHSLGTGREAYRGIFHPHIVPMGDKKLSHRTCACICCLRILLWGKCPAQLAQQAQPVKMVLLQNNVLRSARHKVNKKTVNRTRNCTNISADPLLTSTKRLFVNLFLSYEQRNAKYLWCLSPCLGDLIFLSFSSF